MERLKQLVKQHRLKVFASLLILSGATYNFFDKYQIVLQERGKASEKVVVNDVRTPISDDPPVVAPVDETTKQWRPPIQATTMPMPQSWAYYLKDPILAAIKTAKFDVVVTDTGNRTKFNRSDVRDMKSDGKSVLAYAAFGYAEKFRTYWKEEWNRSLPEWMGKSHPLWAGVFNVKNLLHPEWKEIVERRLVEIMDAGYNGILIDGLSGPDVPSFLNFIYRFTKDRNKDFRIFVQDYIDSDALPFIDGVVKQNLVFNYGRERLDYVQSTIEKLNKIKSEGKIVLVISYAEGPKWALAREIIKDNDFVPYNGPIKLDVIRFKQD